MDTTHYLKKFALALAGAFIAIVAVILNLDQLYLMAAVLFLIPVSSYIVGQAMMRGLVCRREAVPACGVGEQVPVTVIVENTGRLPKLYLRVQDHLPDGLERAGTGAPPVLQLAPGEATAVTYQVLARKRGAYMLGPIRIASTDPLGFYTQTQTVRGLSEMLVYPTILPLRQLPFEGGGAWGQREIDSAPARGGGLDFHGVREYQPGDELRRVHWRTTARTGTLAVMEYTQGVASDVLVALDLNRAAYDGTRTERGSALEAAITITVSVCDYLLRSGYEVRVALPSRLSGPLHLKDSAEMPILLETLARAAADTEETLAETLAQAMLWVSAGVSVLYVTPEPHRPDLAEALLACTARGAETFGYALDRELFTSQGRRQGPARTSPSLTSRVSWVKPEDDLVQIMEGGTDARW